MGRLSKLLEKLVSGKFSEVRDRAREERVKRQERHHHRRGKSHFDESRFDEIFSNSFLGAYRSDREVQFAKALRERPYPFFPGFERPGQFRDWLISNTSLDEKEILTRAGEICENKFPILGIGFLSYGTPPNWRLDPLANKSAPDSFYADIPYLEASSVGDSKVIWELSRWQFVFDLGQAYLATGDEKYPRKFFNLIVDWDESHPDYQGIAFCSALEFAFRINSLIWALDFFHASPSLTDSVSRSIYRLLHLSGVFLENHLSRYFAPNTHLLGEAWGLAILGLLFPEFVAADNWHSLGTGIIETELQDQFTVDGFHAELSTAYHAYCMEFICTLAALLLQAGRKVPKSYSACLRQMVHQFEILQRPDRLWPHIGDEDGGRALFLSRVASHDFKPIVETTKALLTGDGVPFACRFAETFFVAGPTSQVPTGGSNSRMSTLIQGAGYAVLRLEPDEYMLFQAGPFGYLECPHSHADMLHIDYSVGNDNFLIDPGTFVYSGSLTSRNQYRSGALHNGPQIGEFFTPEDPFAWRLMPSCRIVENGLAAAQPSLAAVYTVRQNGRRIMIGRRVEHTASGLWIVTDEIMGKTPIEVGWRFMTPVKIEPDHPSFQLTGADSYLRLTAVSIEGEIVSRVEAAKYSSDYLREVQARAICATVTGKRHILAVWLLQPESAAESRVISTSIADDNQLLVQTLNKSLTFEVKPIFTK